MGRPIEGQPHTLAQFARRAGISEGRARGMLAETPSKLPRPDGTDAGDRPYWFASTIDAWCARTGRTVSSESLWFYRVPPAAAPAAELRRGVLRLGRRDEPFYVIIWDTDHGHVIYLQPLYDSGDHKDWMAVRAAELIEPRWWADAVVVMPVDQALDARFGDKPVADIYRLITDTRPDQGESDRRGVLGGLRRWMQTAMPEIAGPPQPKAEWATQIPVADVAKVLGHPLPLWIGGTDTLANAEQTRAYDRTFTCPDTITDWPAIQARLLRAVELAMPMAYPAGFAALAADANEVLGGLRDAHERLRDSGDGWYLLCRPARPAPPIDLEQRISGIQPVEDTNLVGTELEELRAIEGDLDVDDPRGEIFAEAVDLLQLQLRYAAKQAGTIRDLGEYVPIANDGWARYTAPWGGPVAEAWTKTLTEVDAGQVLRLRRVQRLLRDYPADGVRHVYRDHDGRYVVIIDLSSGTWVLAEWPVSLAKVDSWTDKTVLAGDSEQGTTTVLLALTPTDDGQMRVDPVPLLPGNITNTFAYGYGGGTPATTYRALLRCALGDGPDAARAAKVIHGDQASSQLWTAISTTKGPLRLSWPQVRLWARGDRKAAASLLDQT